MTNPSRKRLSPSSSSSTPSTSNSLTRTTTLLSILLLLLTYPLSTTPANWSQLSGHRAQNTAHPYTPQTPLHSTSNDPNFSSNPMWSARWGHASTVYNSTVVRGDLTFTENSLRVVNVREVLIVLGGDDYIGDDHIVPSMPSNDDNGERDTGHTAIGGLKNDVWYSVPNAGAQSGWNINTDSRLKTRTNTNPNANVNSNEDDFSNVIQSTMTWTQSNPGRISPATYPIGINAGRAMSYKEWIQCQDFFISSLPEPSICTLNPICETEEYKERIRAFYYDKEGTGANTLGWPEECHPAAVWKEENMWSPRRGHKSVVASTGGGPFTGSGTGTDAGGMKPTALYVLGGRAKEYARISRDRTVGGIIGNVYNTDISSSSVREETVLKNDIWISDDGLGINWRMVTPGCEVLQRDLVAQTERWEGKGARIPTSGVGAATFETLVNVGQRDDECVTDEDCWGRAVCDNSLGGSFAVCVCPLWSPRENHAVTVQHAYQKDPNDSTVTLFTEDYIYLVGGFVSIRKSFCGSTSCGSRNEYKFYMDDAWVSNDGGIQWVQFKRTFTGGGGASFEGRGAHAMVVISVPVDEVAYEEGHGPYFGQNQDQLWIMGGEGEAEGEGNTETMFLNDAWYIDLPLEPCCVQTSNCNVEHKLTDNDVGPCLPDRFNWKVSTRNAEWEPRSGHNVVVEPPSAANNQIQRITLIGGNNADTVFDDVWSWGFQVPFYSGLAYTCTSGSVECRWDKDYSVGAWFRIGIGNGLLYYGPGHGTRDAADSGSSAVVGGASYMPTTPHQYYLFSGSTLGELARVYLPVPSSTEQLQPTSPDRYTILSTTDVEQINSVGIFTVHDLVHAHITQLIRLRGYDFPQVVERLTVGDKICDVLALAKALHEKCRVKPSETYEMENHMPRNVRPVFRGNPGVDENWQYRGGGQDSNAHGRVYGVNAEDECDSDCQKLNWNGCDVLHERDEVGEVVRVEEVNVMSFGEVKTVMRVRDPTAEVQEMKCRQNPGGRTRGVAEFFEGNVVVMGGKRFAEEEEETSPDAASDANADAEAADTPKITKKMINIQDTWQRDDHLPTAFLLTRPIRGSGDTRFSFSTDTAGASIFEYKVVDYDEKIDVIGWTKTTDDGGVDVKMLNSQPFDFAGPGEGNYLFYIRAIDPAGNVGYQFSEDSVYLWLYVPPLPLSFIITGLVILGVLLIVSFFEWRRRRRKRAMERYAIKRMRRKFKGVSKIKDKGKDDKDGKKGKAGWRVIGDEDGKKGGKKSKKRKEKEKKMKRRKKEKKEQKGLKERANGKEEEDAKSKKKKEKEKHKKKSAKVAVDAIGKSPKKEKEKENVESKAKTVEKKNVSSSKSKDKEKKKTSAKDKDKEKPSSTKAQDKERKEAAGKEGKAADKYRKEASSKDADKERKKQK